MRVKGASRGWWAAFVVLAIIIAAVYWPAARYGFVGYDDVEYVTENAQVKRGLTLGGVRWAFASFTAANWHPLTMVSHMLDVELFGMSAGRHHLVNLALHLADATLLFLAFTAMTGSRMGSAFVAALFAVHPLHVESVAWIAERKDVLSTLFFLLGVMAYLGYLRRPGTGRYLWISVCHALGLMSKPMVVTFPVALLVLDFWPLGRLCGAGARKWVRLLLEKTPLVVLSVAAGAVAVLAQRTGGAMGSFDALPLGLRVANALTGYAWYVRKMIWPSGLAAFYPHPLAFPPLGGMLGAAAILAFATLAAGAFRRRKPYLAGGWVLYLVTLFPVIGLAQSGAQAVADRYTYVPLTGLFIPVVWGAMEAAGRRPGAKPAFLLAGLLWVMTLGFAAHRQVGYWKDAFTLFSRMSAVTEKNWVAACGLGNEYLLRGEYPKALEIFMSSVRYRPTYGLAWNGIGVANHRMSRYEQAVEAFRKAVRYKPGYARAYSNLGAAYQKSGRFAEAVETYLKFNRLAPDQPWGYYNLGTAYADVGRFPQAVEAFREAIKLDPGYSEAYNGLGLALSRQGRYQEGLGAFREAVRLNPTCGRARFDLGLAYVSAGARELALAEYRELRIIDPPMAERLLALIRAESGI